MQPGDQVVLVAPSGPVEQTAFLAGVEQIQAMGFVPIWDASIFAKQMYLAGEDKQRLSALQAALQHPDATAIWAARGGYGAARLLPYLSPQDVQRANKLLIGFSDITTLHALWARAGVASIHATNVSTLATLQPAAKAALQRLLLEQPSTITFLGRTLQHGKTVMGYLQGGNLSVLASLVGTDFLPRIPRTIVVLEEVQERPYRIDRMLTQLLQAGFFEQVVGVALGQFTRCTESDHAHYNALDAVMHVLSVLNIPIISDIPLGHAPDAHATWLGTDATLNTTDQTFCVTAPV